MSSTAGECDSTRLGQAACRRAWVVQPSWCDGGVIRCCWGVRFRRCSLTMVSMESADVEDVRRKLAVLIQVRIESSVADLVDVAPDIRLRAIQVRKSVLVRELT